ncbi:hypothetical protein ACH4Y0_37615 [Streptomyces sp. NPDC020707]|uniref:hypothetical protein n=1 Tax=Streptomyces sp. NPDC020707 TaxID=3365084 RepID=UPI003788B197
MVVDRLPRQGTVVADAASLPFVPDRLSPAECTVFDLAGEPSRLVPDLPGRAWIRRLAPAGWDANVALGSQAAARLAHADKVDLDIEKSLDLLATEYLVARLREHPLPPLPIDDPKYAEFAVYSTLPKRDETIGRALEWASRQEERPTAPH